MGTLTFWTRATTITWSLAVVLGSATAAAQDPGGPVTWEEAPAPSGQSTDNPPAASEGEETAEPTAAATDAGQPTSTQPAAPADELAAPPGEPAAPTAEAAEEGHVPARYLVKRVRYHEGDTPPEGYELRKRPIKGLVIAGGITLGVFYGMGLSDSDAANEGGTATWMFLPVIGPVVAAVEFNQCARRATTPDDEYDCDNASTTAAGYAVLQAVGAGLIAAGYLGRRRWWIRSASAIRVAPWQTRSALGVDVTGRF